MVTRWQVPDGTHGMFAGMTFHGTGFYELPILTFSYVPVVPLSAVVMLTTGGPTTEFVVTRSDFVVAGGMASGHFAGPYCRLPRMTDRMYSGPSSRVGE